MAKSPKRKLKVFQARLGFYDTIVAATSQAAALRAWGTTQNLFANGEASVVTNTDDVATAMEHPEVVLRRAIGTKGQYALKPTALPSLPDEPAKSKKTVRPKRPLQKPPKPADRSKLDAAEANLRTLDQKHKDEQASFRREQTDLDKRRDASQNRYIEARKTATSKLVKERDAYRKAGGRD